MAMGGDGDARGATQLKYNGTGATGANPLNMDVNIWYEPGDIAWMLSATALVLLMIPGVG
jgi:Amt family ammonium transporter